MAALVGITPYFGALAATHVAFQHVNRRRLRPAHDIERDGLMRVAAETANLKIEVACIEDIAHHYRQKLAPRDALNKSPKELQHLLLISLIDALLIKVLKFRLICPLCPRVA
jgi:hypothetical protein